MESAREAGIVQGIDIFGVDSLAEVVDFLEGKVNLKPIIHRSDASSQAPRYEFDFSDIKGQYNLRRAVEVAVSGGHNLLMLSTYCLPYLFA